MPRWIAGSRPRAKRHEQPIGEPPSTDTFDQAEAVARLSSQMDQFGRTMAHLQGRVGALRAGVERQTQCAVVQRTRNGRVGTLALIITILALSAGASFAYLSVLLFRDPTPAPFGGTVTFSMSESESKTAVYVDFMHVPDGSEEWDMTFPTGLVGESWTLQLNGISELRDFDVSGYEYDVPGRCIMKIGEYCHTFTGTVAASKSIDRVQVLGSCSASPKVVSVGRHDHVVIMGRPAAFWHSTFGFQSVTFPHIEDIHATDEPLSPLRGCASTDIPPGLDISSTLPSPTSDSADTLSWPIGADYLPPSLTLRQRWSSVLSNAGIISAGVLFTIAGGFLPVWVQNRGSLGSTNVSEVARTKPS